MRSAIREVRLAVEGAGSDPRRPPSDTLIASVETLLGRLRKVRSRGGDLNQVQASAHLLQLSDRIKLAGSASPVPSPTR
jgi:hypothetical protein